eukprot:6194275-Pleurochrysis_carterae.AAC.4
MQARVAIHGSHTPERSNLAHTPSPSQSAAQGLPATCPRKFCEISILSQLLLVDSFCKVCTHRALNLMTWLVNGSLKSVPAVHKQIFTSLSYSSTYETDPGVN